MPVITPTPYVDSEVGRLRSVLLHRPGGELKRLTPRNNDQLLFDGIPWVDRAQEEHDEFADALQRNDVKVLYVADLLTDIFDFDAPREEAINSVLNEGHLGGPLRQNVAAFLGDLPPNELADVLIAGLAHHELTGGRGIVYELMNKHDFVISPLPNLLFTRDSSFWVAGAAVTTYPASPVRRREATLATLIYQHHRKFAGIGEIWSPSYPGLEGGDVLALGPGVLAIGTGQRTTPAGVEMLAQWAFDQELVDTILVVPIQQDRATMHLDTICTMVDSNAVVMYPPMADTLVAYRVTRNSAGEFNIDPPANFLTTAADALGIDQLHVIDTGLDPVTAEREQWDDGNNMLCVAPRLVIGYERNSETNARLEEAGIEVVGITASELNTGRGGPRCLSCPISRDPQ